MDDNTNLSQVEESPADESQPVEAPEAETTEAPAEEEPTEAPADDEVAEPEAEPEQAKEEPAPPSRRETLRIQDLLRKYGPPKDQAPSQKPEPKTALDYTQALDADPEVIKQLETDRSTYGQLQYNEGIKRAEYLDWKTSLKIDAPVVEKKYPVLDPSSAEFHPAVADAVNQWYLGMSGHDANSQTVNNPNIGYAEFVEGFMELVQETAGQKNAQSVKNIAKQAATTGLRPDGSSAKRLNLNKAPQEMSMEELYASIGQKPPKK